VAVDSRLAAVLALPSYITLQLTGFGNFRVAMWIETGKTRLQRFRVQNDLNSIALAIGTCRTPPNPIPYGVDPRIRKHSRSWTPAELEKSLAGATALRTSAVSFSSGGAVLGLFKPDVRTGQTGKEAEAREQIRLSPPSTAASAQHAVSRLPVGNNEGEEQAPRASRRFTDGVQRHL